MGDERVDRAVRKVAQIPWGNPSRQFEAYFLLTRGGGAGNSQYKLLGESATQIYRT